MWMGSLWNHACLHSWKLLNFIKVIWTQMWVSDLNRIPDHYIMCIHMPEKATSNSIIFIPSNTIITCCCSNGNSLLETLNTSVSHPPATLSRKTGWKEPCDSNGMLGLTLAERQWIYYYFIKTDNHIYSHILLHAWKEDNTMCSMMKRKMPFINTISYSRKTKVCSRNFHEVDAKLCHTHTEGEFGEDDLLNLFPMTSSTVL